MNRFVLDYDLDLNMRPAIGSLSFGEDAAIVAEQGGAELFRLDGSDVAEAAVIAGVGAGLLYARLSDGGERVLCRFTMSALKPAGEFCKIVNYYAQTKTAAIPADRERRVCPKCGRPIVEELTVCIFCYDRKSALKRFFSLMRPFLKRIAAAEGFLAVSSVLYLLVPLFSRFLIDDHLRPGTGTPAQVLVLALGMLAARAVGELIFIVSARMFNHAAIDFSNHMRNAAYDKVQRLSMGSLARHTPGDLIRRVMEDTLTIKNFLADGGRWAVEQIITFVVVMGILFFTDWKMTLIVFAPVPAVMVLLSRFWRFIHIRYERQWRKHSRCQSILHDIIKGIRTVKSFGNEDVEIAKFSKATRELAEVSCSNEKIWALLFPFLTFFTGAGEFLVLYLGSKAIMRGEMSFGVLVQFTMYIGYVYAPLRWLVSFPRWLADAMTSMVKVFEILDEEPGIRAAEEPEIRPLTGEIRFDGVSFGYKSYEPVLKDVSFAVRPGEMVGIVGRSGVGKSTLINLVMRLYDPNAGRITINGADIRDMPPDYLRESIGVVFQDTFLFAGTIYDNILYAKPDAAPDEVFAACKAANAHDFIMQTSDGYNTVIGENGYSISGGERQRLAIARAIIKNPSILILDEATSSLDVETESVIQESLSRIVSGRTTLAIAHRLSTLRQADRLIVLDKSGIAEMGTHVELLRKKGIYYKLVMAQRQSSSGGKRAAAPAP
ncbi:MAG: ABC transporter ATP-binding protein/permease [Clostridiales bacterium]|jgi:ATP-binding cassette subfamily B protein|nr:ABC transporter ATP-binding protein/permease [Clostridiales bacterium]